MDTVVELQGISKNYKGLNVLENINLSVGRNDFMVICGRPSSGKSVLLRLLTGLEKQTGGKIMLRGRDMSAMTATERNLGYVPQDFALYPHKNVYENIAYPLQLLKKRSAAIKPLVHRAAEMVHIEELLKKIPTQLSGGQKQRVAVARGIVKQTDIYVLDDPLAGLDFKLREKLVDDLKALQKELNACFIYTTSDPIEALSLASRVAILHDGHIRETGRPETVYANPGHLSAMTVLGFPGANTLDGTLVYEASELWCRTTLFKFPISQNSTHDTAKKHTEVTVGFRPETVRETSAKNVNSLSGNIFLREDLGAEEIIYINIRGVSLTMIKPSAGTAHYDVDDMINIRINAASFFVFDQKTGSQIARGAGNYHV